MIDSADQSSNEIQFSIMALQNQIRTMNNNLDEIYAKSKQQLKDLEHHVTCFAHVHSNFSIESPLCSNCRKISQRKAWPP